MSYITQATAGLESVQASKWDDAVRQLSAGIKESPNPAWLIARSRALIGLKRFEEALDDANQAWHVAYERNKRPLLVEAQYRRAVAYFRLGQYANADACCIYSMRLVKGNPAIEKVDPTRENVDAEGFYKTTLEDAKKESRDDPINSSDNAMATQSGNAAVPQAQDWRRASAMRIQALNALEKLPQDDPARKLTAVLKPPFKDVSQKHVTKEKKTPAVTENTTQQPAIVRTQDFQTDTTMTVTLFSKGNDKNATKVEFRDSSIHINSIKYQNGEMRPYALRLWGEIDVDASKYTITPSKIELSLKKKKAGKWNQLQSEANDGEEVQDEQAAVKEQEEKETLETLKEARKKAMNEATEKETEDIEKPKATEGKGKEPAKPAGPSYPTSSRSGPKNWDNIGDDDSDDEKDVNYFFKKLYKNAGPEQQRAMMKSFTESNGTSLSTDWNDVKDRKVETVPPDGVEAKKWD